MLSKKLKWYPLFESKDELEALFVLKNTAIYKNMFVEALFVKDGNDYHAFKNKCPHQHKPLNDCSIHDGHVVCPFHQYHFSLENGRGHGQCLDKYPLRINEDNSVSIGKEVWSLF